MFVCPHNTLHTIVIAACGREIRNMEQEPSPLRIFAEVIWTLILVQYEILVAIYRFFVPVERKDISGEVVLITGTGHGMGREMALRFARLGAKVVCIDINEKSNEETYNMIIGENNKAYKYTCDATDRAAVMELAAKVRKEVGEVDILVNNAGIMPCKPVTQQTEKEIRLLMDININAIIWFIQAFLPSMIHRNHGHIVSMSSIAGLMGLRNLVPYCGSKFAVRGMMEALAFELRGAPTDTSGIHLTTICPAIVNTGLCHKPRIRFARSFKVVEPSEAADVIVDSTLRNIGEVTIPSKFHYNIRYLFRLLPFKAGAILNELNDLGVDAHDD